MNRKTIRCGAAGIIAALFPLGLVADEPPRPTWPPAAAPPAEPRPAESSEPATIDPRIDQILTRLEQRAVRDLEARVIWQTQYFPAFDPPLRKDGRIWFLEARPVARFMIHFTRSQTSTRADPIDEYHIFNGIWYIEANGRPGEPGTVQRHQIRREDDPYDPYKVGQGVFPLPFGQKKAEVLKEFELRLIPQDPADPENTDHLLMTPRPGTRTGEWYEAVHFWIARKGDLEGLPVQVRADKISGTGKKDSEITMRFEDVRFDQGFSADRFDFKTPAGWTEAPPNELPPKPAAGPQPGQR